MVFDCASAGRGRPIASVAPISDVAAIQEFDRVTHSNALSAGIIIIDDQLILVPKHPSFKNTKASAYGIEGREIYPIHRIA